MKLRKLAAITLIGLVITGCDSGEKSEFDKTVDRALNSQDPFTVMDSYYSEHDHTLSNCKLALFASPFCEKVEQSNKKVITAAVEKNSVPALLYLIKHRQTWDWASITDLPENLRSKLIERLSKMAYAAEPTRANSLLFMAAGNAYQDGQYVNQDSAAAIEMYLKAWKAGDLNAADSLVEVYRFLNDQPRMYFWQIRARTVEGRSFQLKSLSSESKLLIQKKAADSSLVNL